ALPVPATVICEMLGVPFEDRDRFTVWTSKATLGLASQFLPPETLAEVQAAGTSLAAYFEELVAARRGHLSDDLLSALIRAEEAGDRLAPPELLSQAIGLLIAGFETTIGLIGNGVRALVRHPAELAKLRARPELAASAVDECLRYDGPIILTPRVLHADVEFGGKTLPKDAQVFGMLAAAQHGGPPAALMARAAEGFEGGEEMQVARLTVELLRPVPLVPLTVTLRWARPGRKVQIVEVALRAGDTEVARALALRIRRVALPVPPGIDHRPPPPPLPGQGSQSPPPWGDGIVRPAFHADAVEHRFVAGGFDRPGPATDWIRLRVPVVA